MASSRVSALLALEIKGPAPRPTADRCRNSRPHPQILTRDLLWGTPRFKTELHLLGFEVAESTVAKYRAKTPKPSSQTWKTFLSNHTGDIAGIDFFTVPTARFRNLYCFIVLLPERRQVVHFNVTAHPTATWTTQQMIEAFPEDTAPRFLLRDRDSIYGKDFQRRVAGMQIEFEILVIGEYSRIAQ